MIVLIMLVLIILLLMACDRVVQFHDEGMRRVRGRAISPDDVDQEWRHHAA